MKKFFYGILLVIIVTALSVPFINWQVLKQPVLTQLQTVSGCQIDLKGSVHLKILPVPQIVLTQVAIKPVSRPIGTASLTLESATAETVGVSWAWGPLWGGKLQIHSLVIQKPIFLLKSIPQTASQPATISADKPPSSPFALSLAEFSLQSGRIVIDAQTAHQKTIQNITMKGSITGLAGPVTLNGQADYKDGGITLDLTIAELTDKTPIQGTITARYQESDYGPISFKGYLRNKGFDGEVHAAHLKIPVLPHPLTAKGTVVYNGKSQLNTHLLINQDSHQLTLDSQTNLEQVITDLKLKSQKITYEKYDFTNLKADLRIKGQEIDFKEISAQIYQGTFHATGHLSENRQMIAQAHLKDVNLAVIPALKETPLQKGRLDCAANLSFNLNHPAEMLETVSGVVGVTMKEGIVETLDIKTLIHNLKNIKDIKGLIAGLETLPKQAPLSINVLKGDFYLKKGVADTQNLYMAADEVIVNGQGQLNLKEMLFNLLLKIKINQLPKWPALPFKLSGTWQHPHYGIDQEELGSMVTKGLANHFMDQMANTLNQSLKTSKNPENLGESIKPEKIVKDLIGGLLG